MKILLKFIACLFAGVVVATLVYYAIIATAFGRGAFDRLPGWIPLLWIIFGAAISGWLGYRSDADIKKSLRFEDRGPATINGFGTTFYGRRDFRADGSYITTEWIVALYIPLIPVRSLRVRYTGPGEHRWYLGFGSSENYTVYEKRFPPHWKQVFFTYGYITLLLSWASAVCWTAFSHFSGAFSSALGVVMIFIVCIIPVPIPWILWHYAEKEAYERHDA